MDNFLFRLSNFFLYIIYSFNYTNKKREAGGNTAGVIDTTSRTPARPPYLIWFRPFADNEADQIRTYVVRNTYRQGALCPSI